MKKQLKLVWYADSPTVNTGFGVVSRNLLSRIWKYITKDIDIFGINYYGEPHNLPYRIYPAATIGDRDLYGSTSVWRRLEQMNFDVLFTLQDSFILAPVAQKIYEIVKQKNAKWIVYVPVDSTSQPEWFQPLLLADVLIPYTRFGKNVIEKYVGQSPTITEPIPHGIDSVFFEDLVFSKSAKRRFRQQYFNLSDDTFLIIEVNRNSQRKDIPRTMQIFKLFQKKHENTRLYIHAAVRDIGNDLSLVARTEGILNLIKFPANFNVATGVPIRTLQKIYRSADVFLTATKGEGFGLTIIEAIANGTPTLAPAHTSIVEIFEDLFGDDKDKFLLKCGNEDNLNLTIYLSNDLNVRRMLVDIDDALEKLEWVYNNPLEAKHLTIRAAKRAKEKYNWDKIFEKHWKPLFEKIGG